MRKSRFLFVVCLSLFVAACDDGGQNTPALCGNGALDPGEACDGDEVPVEGCSALGYYRQTGDLACAADCTLDLTVCAGRCGDGAIDLAFGEDCEGGDLAGETCTTLGLGTGTLACAANCSFDTTGCQAQAVCGDGDITAPLEECEYDDLAGETCATLGYYGGELSCDSDCTFELVSCATFGRCGDAQVQTAYGEDCDGANLNGGTCAALGFYAGDLSCGADCAFDLTVCEVVGRCGDDVRQADWGEVCDGADLNGETCESLGYHGGALACDVGCQAFDETGCAAVGRCGDGVVQDTHGELCDGEVLSGQSCETLGYYGGTLVCADCTFDVSGCAAVGRCGDDLLQSAYGEVCDGMSLNALTCVTAGYYGGTLACNADCHEYNYTNCITTGRCGDGTVQSGYGEECDDGGESANCDLDCTVAQCGDGVLNVTAGEACDDGNTNVQCLPGCMPIIRTLFSEDFSDNFAGWMLGPEWAIGPTIASPSPGACGNGDPGLDHTPTADNGVAGAVIGGNVSTSIHQFYYLTSPYIYASGYSVVKLEFWRWLNSDYDPFMIDIIEIWNGSVWVMVWQNGGPPGIMDAAWTKIVLDITSHANPMLRVRFGHNINSGGPYTCSGWNLDDILITGN